MTEIIYGKKGLLIFKNEKGELQISEMSLPIKTYIATVAWAEDMLYKIDEHSRFRKWLLRIVLGRYAFRELVGLKDSIKKEWCWIEGKGYGLEDMDYHKQKARL